MVDELTHSTLLQILSYDPLTGIFRWKVKHTSKAVVGNIAGWIGDRGYIYLRLFGKLYRTHRLAWFYYHGFWPTKNIDHENGIRSQNQIKNLRDLTQLDNLCNQIKAKSNNKSGLLGVSYKPERNKYQARIKYKGVQTHIGYFDTAEEAHQAYLIEKRKLNPSCTI